MTIVVGSRVEYIGATRPDWLGIPATVTSMSSSGTSANVKFDRKWTNSMFGGTNVGDTGLGINPKDLKEIVLIDPNRPIRFARDHDRPITKVGVMPDGNIVATSVYGDERPWETPIVFDKNTGYSLDPSRTLQIENAPVVSSGFYPLRAGRQGFYGRGLVTLDLVAHDYPEAEAYVEVIYTDNKPTGAKFHAK